MDKTTFRILDTLSRDLASPVSINELTKRITRLHSPAYYKNVYDRVHELSRRRLLSVSTTGNASQVSLNLGSYLLTDMLAEVEMINKRTLLENREGIQAILMELESCLSRDFPLIDSVSLVAPKRNLSLNRLEFLIILKRGATDLMDMHLCLRRLQSMHNISIDPLILSESEFTGFLRSSEYNPLKDMLSDKIAVLNPVNLWRLLSKHLTSGMVIKSTGSVDITRIPEKDLSYNLERFGYREFGTRTRAGRRICLECIIISAMLSSDARKRESVPILLAKNKINYSLLVFLCQEHNILNKLLGLLNTLKKIKCSNEALSAIRILEAIGIDEEKADLKGIKKKMELYHAT